MRIPPVLPYIDIDYYELLVRVEGTVYSQGKKLDIEGVGKYDCNFNRW